MSDSDKYPTITISLKFPNCEAGSTAIMFKTTVDEIANKHVNAVCNAALELNRAISAMQGEAV